MHPERGKLMSSTRKHYSISFSLPNEVIEALNEKVGGTKGARSAWATEIFRKHLGI